MVGMIGMVHKKMFDFIIIGGGTAGSVLANRLSANPENKVLMVEAGRNDHKLDFRIHMPAALTYPLKGKTYNWFYQSEPEPFMNNRRIYQARGKVLGGSSTINGMIFIRGNPLDYEKWAENKGLENWDYASCLPYFRRFESRFKGGDSFRNTTGPIPLTTPKCENPLFDAFFRSVQEAGHPLTEDINGFQQEGFGKFDATIYQGRRFSTARSYIHPILGKRKNFKLMLKTLVKRILFDGKKAIGIEVLNGSSQEKIFGNEIIVCGGAINSPQILQLSGIGNSDELKKLSIPVVHHLPGVGENLQDHLEVYIQWAAKKPVSLFPHLAKWKQPFIGYQWLFHRRGIGASNHFEAGGFVRSNDQVKYPNLQFHFLPIAIRYDGSAPAEGHGFQLHVGPMNTDVKGSVKIQSSDPRVYPKIRFNYLSTEKERKEWIEAIRISRNLINQKAFDELRGEEIAPGNKVQTDQEILDFVAREGESAYHPSCTNKMGYDDMSVVDSNLKVHGINNLRIVDASIMPSITNGNLFAPVMMIGEKAADIILGNTPLPKMKINFYRICPEKNAPLGTGFSGQIR